MIWGGPKRWVDDDDVEPNVVPIARCYAEFCTNAASLDLIDHGNEPFNPDAPTYKFRGWWGWCVQHRPRHRADGPTVH